MQVSQNSDIRTIRLKWFDLWLIWYLCHNASGNGLKPLSHCRSPSAIYDAVNRPEYGGFSFQSNAGLCHFLCCYPEQTVEQRVECFEINNGIKITRISISISPMFTGRVFFQSICTPIQRHYNALYMTSNMYSVTFSCCTIIRISTVHDIKKRQTVHRKREVHYQPDMQRN